MSDFNQAIVLPRIFADPKGSQLAEITQLLFQFGSQVGSAILHPVSATEPAASSPETSADTVNTSSGPDFGGCASPMKMFGINS